MRTSYLLINALIGAYLLLLGYAVWPARRSLEPGREKNMKLKRLCGYVILALTVACWALKVMGFIKPHYP
ncbi:MAG: hypothetical protein ACP5I8_14655 [Phycisphaerae bacterium]